MSWKEAYECRHCKRIHQSICDSYPICIDCGESGINAERVVGRWVKTVDIVRRRFLWPKRVSNWHFQLLRDYKEASKP